MTTRPLTCPAWTFLSSMTALLCLVLTSVATASPGNVDLPRYPSISPDGTQIIFSWRGDLWRVSAAGGTAIRITNHPGDDTRSQWSPDGRSIAFTSDRNGYTNIYLMSSEGSEVRQLTDVDRPCLLSGFGIDQQGQPVVTFAATLEGDVFREYRPYQISVHGGDVIRAHDAFGSHPVYSPNGSQVVFTRGGYYGGWIRRHYRGPDNQNVWLHDCQTGAFTRLTEFDGQDGNPRWQAPGVLLYLSDCEHRCVNLYRMSAAEGERHREPLTTFDTLDVRDFDVSADGTTVVLMVWDTLYTLDLTNPDAQPTPITIYASEDEKDNYELKRIDRTVNEAALSPDGKVMAVVAYGEIYVRNLEDGSPTRRVTNNHAREKDIAWSPNGLKLYFTSDHHGHDAIYAATVNVTRGDVKDEFDDATGKKKDETEDEVVEEDEDTEPAAEEPTDDGPAAASNDDPVTGIWEGVAEVPESGSMPFALRLKLEAENTVTGTLEAGPFSGAISGTFDPDTATLDLVATTAEEVGAISFMLTITNGTATGTGNAGEVTIPINITRTGDLPTPEEDDDENGKDKKKKKEKKELPKELQIERWHDAMTFNLETVLQLDHPAREVSPSPDGTMLAFRGVRGNIHILDLESQDIRTLLESWDAGVDWQWSPDSTYLAYAVSDLDFNNDVFITRADGTAEPINITRHPDGDGSPSWSADGKILCFVSDRVDDEFDVWAVYLEKDLEALTPQELKAYYKDAVAAAKKRKPLKIDHPDDEEEEEDQDAEGDEDADADEEEEEEEVVDEEPKGPYGDLDLDDAYLRLRRITRLNGSEYSALLTPGGDRIIFTAGGENSGLFSVKWDGTDQKRLSGFASMQHVTLTGDNLVVVSGSQAGTVSPGGGSVKTKAISDRIRIDLQEQSRQKFLEAARRLGEEFADPTMNGTDWPALTEQYLQLALTTRTSGEFNWVANFFIGELSGSHLGIRAPDDSSPQRQSLGRLGTVHQRVEDGFLVTDIIPESPAAKGPMALHVGDVMTAIEFEPFGETDTIETRLRDRAGKETVVSVRRTTEDGEAKDLNLLITPTSFGAIRGLIYREWRLENARLVDEWSDGRLGYTHIQSMNQPSLDVFERDLFAACDGKDGLVIDVRNNGGGWTADRLLASIMVQEHAYTVPRGADWSQTGHYPKDRLFIQRYTLPINMLCNQKSYSNAEIIAHAFKVLKRGTLVGQQTHGSVISTGGFGLIDGTTVRLPFRAWFVDDKSGPGGTGTNMEFNGAMPDIVVEQRPEHEVAGDDLQLKAAVDDLLQRLPAQRD